MVLGVVVSGVVPGFFPRMPVDPAVGLFRVDERFSLPCWMAGGRKCWHAALTTQTIKQRYQLLERIQRFTREFPWQWHPGDVDDFLADLSLGREAD